jgi:uncharacterized membrane protein
MVKGEGSMPKRILLAGESWTSYTTHVKGFDAFYTSAYEEGAEALIEALKSGGFEVDYLPHHVAPTMFPFTVNEMVLPAAVRPSAVSAAVKVAVPP